MKIFLTGVTGFIGSYIGAELSSDKCEGRSPKDAVLQSATSRSPSQTSAAGRGTREEDKPANLAACDASTGPHQLICLRRKNSNPQRCAAYANQITWIDADSNWVEQVIAQAPDAIIHAGWAGVTAAERDDWKLQTSNLNFFSDLLQISLSAPVRRFIALGSVAEYGQINQRVDESFPCRPVSAYGAVKVACLTLLQTFAAQIERAHRGGDGSSPLQIAKKDKTGDEPSPPLCSRPAADRFTYAWLRLFSTYGPGEGQQWFMPTILKQMRSGQSPKMTACEQRYDYLHVKDVARGIRAALETPANGVFNLTSNSSHSLKEIVLLLKKYSGAQAEPAFGALPYRPNQSMLMEGDSSKFYATFGFQPSISLEQGLKNLVEATT